MTATDTPVVHGVKWAGQPDLQVLCTDEWTTPRWGQRQVGPVHEADNGQLYTFDLARVTCAACRAVEHARPDR